MNETEITKFKEIRESILERQIEAKERLDKARKELAEIKKELKNIDKQLPK